MNGPLYQANPGQGGPIAGPTASHIVAVSPLVDGQSRPIRSGNSGALQGTTAPPNRSSYERISSAAIDDINSHLSDRDRAILRSVDEHQFLTARHIEILHFSTVSPNARSRIARRALA